MERLDDAWGKELEKLKKAEDVTVFKRSDLQIFLEQLACYFIFRHFESGVGFAIVGCWTLGMICSACENVEEMLDVARMFSSEVEYCEENTEKVKAFLKNYGE